MPAADNDRTHTDSFNRSVRASLLEDAIRWILHATEPRVGRLFFDASGGQPMSNAHRLEIEDALRKQAATFLARGQLVEVGGWHRAGTLAR